MYPYSLFYLLCMPRPMLVFMCMIKYFTLLVQILPCTYIPSYIHILVHVICSLIYCICLIITWLFNFCFYIFVLSLVPYDRSLRKRTDPWTLTCVLLKNPGRWSLRECVKHLKLSEYAFLCSKHKFSCFLKLFIYLFILSTDIVQPMEYLPSSNEALILSLMLHKLIVVVHSWNSRTQKVKAHGSEIESHPQQHREFQASLGCVRSWEEGQYEI